MPIPSSPTNAELAARIALTTAAQAALCKPASERTALDLATLRGFALLQISTTLDILHGALGAAILGGAEAAALGLHEISQQLCLVAKLIPGINPAPAVQA